MLKYAIAFLLTCASASAYQRAQGWCEQGGKVIVGAPAVGQAPVTRGFQQSYKSCTVTVYLTGTATLATIYSNASGSALANPFTADQYGLWFFYAANGRYDVQISGGGPPALAAPYTFGDIELNSEFWATSLGAVCNWSGASGTDDAIALQAAINAVASAGGGALRFGPGACSFSTPLTVPNTVKLQGGSAGLGAGSRLVYTGNPSVPTAALVFASAAPGNFTTGMEGISLSAYHTANANSIGIYLGGDPANVISPSTSQEFFLHFMDNYIYGFGVGAQYGNNSGINEWRGNTFSTNLVHMYAPTGITDTGDSERMYGGLFTSGTNGGVKLFNFFYEFYGTHFEFNTNWSLNVDAGIISCFGCIFELVSESGGAMSGIPITTWNNKNPYVMLKGGGIFYNCASPTQSEYVNFDSANSVNFSAEDMTMGSFFGCAATRLVSAQLISDVADSNISLRRIATSTTVMTQPLRTNVTNTLYENLAGLGKCYACDGSGFSGAANVGLQGLQFNSVPLLFGPLPASGGTNTSAFDVALNHWITAGALAIYSGPPAVGGVDQTLLPLYAGNWVNSFDSATATPALSTAQQGEIYQRNQGALAQGRQRVCSGDPSQSAYRTCLELESNGGTAPTAHNQLNTYVLGTQVGHWSTYGNFSNGLGTAIKEISADYGVAYTDSTLLCDATGGAVGITLPPPAAINLGRIYVIKKIDSSGNACNIGSASGQIDGAGSISLATQYFTRTLQNDGTNWWIIGN